MRTPLPSDAGTFSSRLEKHSHLRACVERLLDLCEGILDDLDKADDAEERVSEELRALGQEMFGDGAAGQVEAH